ncbi:hypothetical protein [Cohnella yongneupensis]|uniref:Uncharacterized protein n=1 Tax=Cohnella yongneupensis TaxID=425006 RepID=A0ABW0QVE0_9BACL
MRYMRVKRDFSFPDRTVERGEILGVEDDHRRELLYILAGPLANRSVHIDHLEEIDVLALNEELLNCQAQIRVLNRAVEIDAEQMESDMKLAVANADRLQDNVIQLTRELREEREGKKVPIPRTVAEALQKVISNPFHDKAEEVVRIHARSSCDWSREVNALHDVSLDTVIRALYYGYTIEETPEEKVLDYFNSITPAGWKFSGDANDPVYIERNAIRTTCSILGKEIAGLNAGQK